MTSYPVAWWEGRGATRIGALSLHDGHLELDGRTRDSAAAAAQTLSFDELVSVRVERSGADRLDGRPALVLGRTGGEPLNLASLGGLGSLHELAEALGAVVAARPRRRALEVVVVGGGVAGLEAVLALRELAAGLARVTLLAAEPTFAYRPLDVLAPGDRAGMGSVELAAVAADCGAELHLGTLAEVDTTRRRVLTAAGAELPYDALLLAVGARPEEAVPGALTFAGPHAREHVEGVLGELAEGRIRSLAFAVPGGVTWPLPLYELALAAAARARGGATLTLVTPEAAPLAVFGDAAADAVRAELHEAGVRLRTGAPPVDARDGVLRVIAGDAVEAERVIALPRLLGPGLVGVPADERGFVRVDPFVHVVGLRDVWAAGDATSFPVKQGGLAAQQAAVAAAGIAARADAAVSPPPFRPVLRGLLLTGGGPLFLRAELGGGAGETSVAATEPLWWPPGKIAGRYLSGYLAATARVAAA